MPSVPVAAECTWTRCLRLDPSRASARPWLYGIAANLVGRHRRSERRRLHAMARLAARQPTDQNDVVGEHAAGSLDAAEAWSRLAGTVTSFPPSNVKHCCCSLGRICPTTTLLMRSACPLGPCVRDSTGPGVGYANTIRARAPKRPGLISRRPTPMTDELDPLRRLRADDLLPTDPPDAELLAAARRRLLAGIAGTPSDDPVPQPSVYTRLGVSRTSERHSSSSSEPSASANYANPGWNIQTGCWHGSSSAMGSS